MEEQVEARLHSEKCLSKEEEWRKRLMRRSAF